MKVILDLLSRQVVGWSFSPCLTELTTMLPAPTDAIYREHPDVSLILYSDQAVKYGCHEFRNKLAASQIIQSMSGKENCDDNAVTESFFAPSKASWFIFNSMKSDNKHDTASSDIFFIFTMASFGVGLSNSARISRSEKSFLTLLIHHFLFQYHIRLSNLVPAHAGIPFYLHFQSHRYCKHPLTIQIGPLDKPGASFNPCFSGGGSQTLFLRMQESLSICTSNPIAIAS
ncbi:MAG: hypothetical protein ONB37_10670, partial [candidate division KSB1 bacterium]|nr:hypothetical protein [candidate division KSB1 bacterium]